MYSNRINTWSTDSSSSWIDSFDTGMSACHWYSKLSKCRVYRGRTICNQCNKFGATGLGKKVKNCDLVKKLWNLWGRKNFTITKIKSHQELHTPAQVVFVLFCINLFLAKNAIYFVAGQIYFNGWSQGHEIFGWSPAELVFIWAPEIRKGAYGPPVVRFIVKWWRQEYL